MKPWYTSKTLWVGVLTGVLGIVQSVQPIITDPKLAGVVVSIIGGINLLLRMVSFQGLSK